MNSIDPRVIQLWRLQGLVRLLTFWLPVLAVVGVGVGIRLGAMVGVGLAGGLGLVQIAQVIFWPSLSWRYFRFGVREHDLLVESGVLFRHTVSVPLDRIQHVDTRQGPMERFFGLSRLMVFTAAGMAADAAIPGLSSEDADRLRDRLSRRSGDDGV